MIHFLRQIDGQLLEYLYSIRSVSLSNFFIFVTEFGSPATVGTASLAVCGWFALKKRYADILGLIVTVCGSATFILILKYTINRARPDIIYQVYMQGPFYSFPSAHAGLSMAFYGYLFYILMQTYWTNSRRVVAVLLPTLILLIGFSRLYLGVHFLTDVLAGYTIGLICILLGKVIRLRALR
jgi:undecaprenyl-diphosphatase